MHDRRKAPTEIIEMTLRHPDDRRSSSMTIQGHDDLRSTVSFFLFIYVVV